MKRILAIILIISGFSFLIVKILNWKFTLLISLLLNILGFIPIALGYAIFKSSLNKSKKEINSLDQIHGENNKAILKDIPPTSDHSQYMPK